MVVSLTMRHYKLFSSALVPSKDGIELTAKGSVVKASQGHYVFRLHVVKHENRSSELRVRQHQLCWPGYPFLSNSLSKDLVLRINLPS